MSWTYADAQAWASEHSLADVPRLARLEGFAFQRYPDIVAGFGDDGRAMVASAGRPVRSPAHRVAGLALVLLLIGGAVAPVAGLAFLAAGMQLVALADPFPAEFAIPAAGVCFAVGAVMQLLLGAMWIRTGALWDPGVLGISATAAVTGALTLGALPVVAARDGYLGAGPWSVPVWAGTSLAGILAIAVLARRSHRFGEVDDSSASAPPTVSDRERARQGVRALDEGARAGIRADRDAALRILYERGLIQDAELDRALAAELGTLFTLDPLRSA